MWFFTFLLLLPSWALADCEAPVAFGSPKFKEQMKKADYDLVFAGKVISSPATDAEGDVSALLRDVIISRNLTLPGLKVAGESTPVTLKKAKGVRLEPGATHIFFVHREKDHFVLRACNHSYPSKSQLVADMPKDVEAIRANFSTQVPITPAR